MGNNLSTGGLQSTAPTSRTTTNDFLGLGELGGEASYEKSMGTSRFLKTIRARHKDGALVVKVFVKPDPSLSLKAFHRRIKLEKEALLNCPNVLTYQRYLETERAGYLMRQWVASNLYDRISTRPFLSLVEKRWVAFQLLSALKHARERNVSHGDIKTENVLVTSWNWIYLSDFASFKPTYLPLDNPATYSYYFDTSSRRTCYLAPERFYAPGSEIAKRKEKLEIGKKDGKVTEAMDVFSAGCVLAELWMEGTPPFTLSQLYKYRDGEYNPESYLSEIEDVEIRNLIRSMISLDPSHRLTFDEYLSQYRGTAFPTIFYNFLHPFLSSLNESSQPTVVQVSTPVGGRPSTATPTVAGGERVTSGVSLKTDADERIELVWSEWELVKAALDEAAGKSYAREDRRPEAAESSKAGRGEEIFPMRLHIPGLEAVPVSGATAEDGPALILLSLICANIRNCLKPMSVLRAIEVLLALSGYLTDETKLDRLTPYLVALLEDESASVRASALKALTQTLVLVRTITPSNAALFTEYIFPNTKVFASDAELLPRTTYAQCIAPLAQTAARFLEMKEAMKTEGTFKSSNAHDFDGADESDNYDTSLQELQAQVQDHLNPLLNNSPSIVKRALLMHIGDLCLFFGRIKANDAVLAHLMTYLNTRDWLLRKAWNEHAVDVAACVGPRSLEEYILPMVMLSLSDAEEFVTAAVLKSLTLLTEKRLLARGKIWELVSMIAGFLCHPNIWIREGAAAFLASTAKLLQPTDRWCILYPTIRRLLRADIKEISDLSLLDNAREPLSRVLFEAAVTWASRAGKSNFWSVSRASAKGAPRDASVRTDEDHAQLEKMRQLGMKPEDEAKLSVLKDYISKVADARKGSSSRLFELSDALSQTGPVVLKDLGIVPQTFIFHIRTAEDLAGEMRDGNRSTLDGIPRRFSTETPRSPGSDFGRGGARHASQPLDDLRRRLAIVGASSTSLNTQVAGSEHPQSPTPNAAPSSPARKDVPSLERTISHTTNSTDELSDTLSHTDIVQGRARSRVHLNSVEVGRAAPAVGQDTTNAVGLFNVDARYKGDEDAASAVSNVASAVPVERVEGTTAKVATRFISTYDGSDPRIKQLLERVYLDNYREPLPELGPKVPSGIPRRKALRTSFPPRERPPSRPEGTLIAHLVEHTAAITDIQVSPDQLFFATGSEDGSVKIWDTIRLEKNVTSRSRQTFQQGGKITSICILENSHCVASASDNGTLWIHRVDISLSGSMPRYSRPHLIRQQTSDTPGVFVTCMTSFNTDTTTNLVCCTSHSSIVVLDIRTMRNLQTLSNPVQFGPISCVCMDLTKTWIVVGTTTGTMALWDLRFGLLLRSWSVGNRRIQRVALHPSKGKDRWIVVAAEDDGSEDDFSRRHGSLVVEVWDVDAGAKVEEFRVLSAGQAAPKSNSPFSGTDFGPTAMREADLDAAAAIEALLDDASAAGPKVRARISSVSATPDTSNQAAPPDSRVVRPGVQCFLVGRDYSQQNDQRHGNVGHQSTSIHSAEKKDIVGYLMMGGEDRKLRFWDLAKIDRSAIVSGLDLEDDRPGYSAHTSTTRPSLYLESPPSSGTKSRTNTSGPSKVHRSTIITNSQQQLLRGHQDAITALAVIDLPFRCVVSGDRTGIVKVFE